MQKKSRKFRDFFHETKDSPCHILDHWSVEEGGLPRPAGVRELQAAAGSAGDGRSRNLAIAVPGAEIHQHWAGRFSSPIFAVQGQPVPDTQQRNVWRGKFDRKSVKFPENIWLITVIIPGWRGASFDRRREFASFYGALKEAVGFVTSLRVSGQCFKQNEIWKARMNELMIIISSTMFSVLYIENIFRCCNVLFTFPDFYQNKPRRSHLWNTDYFELFFVLRKKISIRNWLPICKCCYWFV